MKIYLINYKLIVIDWISIISPINLQFRSINSQIIIFISLTNYLKINSMANQHNINLKYLVVGDSGVGKTSILVRYCEDSFQTDYLSTIGVDFKIKRIELNNHQVTLNIWDTAGQERFRNITKSFYKGAHGIVLTYSIVDHNSFAHIQTWVDQIREVGNSETNMILVASKADLQMDRKVSRQQGEDLAERYNIKFVEVSAKEDCNISRIFQLLTTTVVERLSAQQKIKQSTSTLSVRKEFKKKEGCCQ